MSINRQMDKKAVVHIHDGILPSHKKDCIWLSSNEVDGPRAYYMSEVNQKEKDKCYTLTHTDMWNLERWYWCAYVQGTSGGADTDDRPADPEGGRRGRGRLRKRHASRAPPLVRQTAGGDLLPDAGNSDPVLCDNLEG